MRAGGAAALLAFALVALLVATGETAPFDRAVLLTLRRPDAPGVADVPARLVHAAILLSLLGIAWVRAGLALAAAGWLALRRERRAAAVLVLAWGGGQLLVQALKAAFHRARPDVAFRLSTVTEPSFPSGHAVGAMLLFPLAGALLAGRAGATAGVALALMIGLTRVLLGVHWASDVAGGWLLGGGIALLALAAVRTA